VAANAPYRLWLINLDMTWPSFSSLTATTTEPSRDQLEKDLTMLKREGFVEAWHDRCLTAGEAVDGRSAPISSAPVLLLVSPDFLASGYCYEREMGRAIERHNARLATVVLIILARATSATRPSAAARRAQGREAHHAMG
jgi:hypothetical protein